MPSSLSSSSSAAMCADNTVAALDLAAPAPSLAGPSNETPAVDDPTTPADPTQSQVSASTADKQETQISVCMTCCSNIELVQDPRSSAETPSSSSQLPYGMMLPCPYMHVFCISCLNMCIAGRLEDGRFGKKVFPMLCPFCPQSAYAWQMTEAVAEKVLSAEMMEEWIQQKFLNDIPKMYCPNVKCSEIVSFAPFPCVITDAECPSCKERICVPCRSVAHPKLSCAQWQKAPESMNPEEIHLRRMAKRHRWRRCTSCRMIVERTEGCSHMTCKCGREYCHQCGSDWINGCTNGGKCGRWAADPTLYVPSRLTTFVRETVKFFQQKSPLTTKPPADSLKSPTRTRFSRAFSTSDAVGIAGEVALSATEMARPSRPRRFSTIIWNKKD